MGRDVSPMPVEEEQLSHRMPESILDDLDAFAEAVGVSRNGAINLLVAQGLREEGYRDPPRQRPHSPWGHRFDGERRGRE